MPPSQEAQQTRQDAADSLSGLDEELVTAVRLLIAARSEVDLLTARRDNLVARYNDALADAGIKRRGPDLRTRAKRRLAR